MSLLLLQECAEEGSALWWREELLAEEWTGREIKYLLYKLSERYWAQDHLLLLPPPPSRANWCTHDTPDALNALSLCLMCFSPSPWNFLSTQPVYASLPISPAQVPLTSGAPPQPPSLSSFPCLIPTLPWPHKLIWRFPLQTQHCYISFCNSFCCFSHYHSRKIGNYRKIKRKMLTLHNPETTVINLWHVSSTFLWLCVI